MPIPAKYTVIRSRRGAAQTPLTVLRGPPWDSLGHAELQLGRLADAAAGTLAVLDDLHHPDAEKVRAKLAAADGRSARAGSAAGQQ